MSPDRTPTTLRGFLERYGIAVRVSASIFSVVVACTVATAFATYRHLGPTLVEPETLALASGTVFLVGLLSSVAIAAWLAGHIERENARYTSIMASAFDAFLIVDARGTVRSASASAESVLGWRPEALVGRPAGVLVPESHRSRYEAFLEEYARTGDSPVLGTTLEVEALREDGSVFPCELSVARAEPKSGPAQLSAVIRDISERKRNEEAIAAAAEAVRSRNAELERARISIAGLNVAALAMQGATSMDDLLQVITEHARELIGAHQAVTSFATDANWAQAITGLSLSPKYAAYGDYDKVPDGSGIYALVCETKRPVRMTQAELEAHPRWKGFGSERDVHPPMVGWLAAPILTGEEHDVGLIQLSDPYDGEFTESDEATLVQLAEMASATVRLRRFQDALEERGNSLAHANVLLIREVAEREQARARLVERTRDLERSNQELDHFAYVASHDLKEPLRGIHNYSGFLLEDHGERLDESGRSKLETLVRLSQRLERLIDDLLYYSRVGRARLAFVPTPVQDVVEDAVATLAPLLEERGVTVRVTGSLPTVTCDRLKLGEVFRHLIQNGALYNDKAEKWLEIGARDADQPTGEDVPPTVFFVRDNGIGIVSRHLEKIFGIFKRLHGRDVFDGSGVGLTIVRKIIERHGGRIWAESAPGVGTTFFFTLAGDPSDADPEKPA